jgi:phosphoribosylanthranilate isomerase
VPTEVKICGLKTAETVEAAIAAGASFVGFVFYLRSPRNVTLEQARQLAELARGRAKIVALIVDAEDTLIEDIARDVRPDLFQAHGKESARRIAEISRRTGIAVIKAVKIGSAEDLGAGDAYDDAASIIMYDAKLPEGFVNALPGGNGVAFDWSLLTRSRRHKPFILSGGLTPDNVADAIRLTNAPIVDVSSGVESAPGVKDIGLIRKFIEAARPGR